MDQTSLDQTQNQVEHTTQDQSGQEAVRTEGQQTAGHPTAGQQTAGHSTEQQPQQQAQYKQESNSQINWKRIRDEKQALEQEREYWRKKAEQAAQSQPSDDDLVEQKDLRKTKQEIQRDLVNLKLAAKFPDFDEVVSQANLTRFANEEPELAMSIDQTQDLYAKAVSAYKNIKYKQYNQRDHEKKQVTENSQKPRPLASISPQEGNSPLSHANAFANGLTPELQKQLWKEMNDCKNG